MAKLFFLFCYLNFCYVFARNSDSQSDQNGVDDQNHRDGKCKLWIIIVLA